MKPHAEENIIETSIRRKHVMESTVRKDIGKADATRGCETCLAKGNGHCTGIGNGHFGTVLQARK